MIGYPTANLRIRAEPSPLTGVLATWARINDGPWLPGVSNLGRRPVVGGRDPLLEVHFFDFDEDIYGQRLDVQFVAKLREETNFDSLEALVEQMKKDEGAARAVLARRGFTGTSMDEIARTAGVGKDTLYRIHGTNQPNTIGQALSSGCIRMLNDEVIDLYDRVDINTPVVVL